MIDGFCYAPPIIEQFPQIIGGVLVVRGVKNHQSSEDLKTRYLAEQQAVLTRLAKKQLSEIDSLAAWRKAFRQFGVDPTQYRAAPEALLRRLQKKGDIPSINTLVDIGNLISIRYAIPVAVMNIGGMTGRITVQFAEGNEPFTELDSDAVLHPEKGEVVFVDGAGVVQARRWCWRQSAQSAATAEVTDVLIVMEAQHENARILIEHAQGDLIELITSYQNGVDLIAGIVDARRPCIPRQD